MYRRLTEEEKRGILHAWLDGKTIKAVMFEFKIATQTIYRILKQFNITHRRKERVICKKDN